MANNKKVEDIFDEVDKTSSPKKTSPNKAMNNANAPIIEKNIIGANDSSNSSSKSRTPFIILIVFIVLVIAGMIYLVVTGTFTDDENEITNAINSTVTNKVNNTTTNPTTTTGSELNIDELDSGELDTDGDGLTDAEEEKIGTLISQVDSDGDGLFDREEVKVYGTNPSNSDSDGDGELDGVEVANGYNPNGTGLLLDLQNEIDNL